MAAQRFAIVEFGILRLAVMGLMFATKSTSAELTMEFFQDLVPASTPLPNPDPLRRASKQLNPGDVLFSRLKAFQLVMQSDGNLVLYATDDSVFPDFKYVNLVWASGTTPPNMQGTAGAFCKMQNDGNLVIYDSTGNVPLWHSGTEGNPGAFLRCQDDGNLVIIAPNGGVLAHSNSYAGPH
jgi:hypothetical protein